jgi:hypothetical protein
MDQFLYWRVFQAEETSLGVTFNTHRFLPSRMHWFVQLVTLGVVSTGAALVALYKTKPEEDTFKTYWRNAQNAKKPSLIPNSLIPVPPVEFKDFVLFTTAIETDQPRTDGASRPHIHVGFLGKWRQLQ